MDDRTDNRQGKGKQLADYVQRELLALRELGREAMERNPALEPFFGTPGRDPDVERLLEGFAFLVGRLRQKLDDELPEVVHGLFSRLWPNYLRPVPAASIIQYQVAGNTTGAAFIPRGTLVESAPVDDVPCRFQTVYDTEILPLQVEDVRFLERGGAAIMAVRFAVASGVLGTLPLSRLRVFFTGEKDETIPYTLYLNLTRRLKEIRFVVKDSEQREHVAAVLPPSCVRPLGFREDEGLYPYPKETALGYRILQEYFCYPEKFLFVEIAGLEQGLTQETLARFGLATKFELHFILPALPEHYESFQASNWNLRCTPVVNIFPFETAQQKIMPSQFGYKIIPDEKRPDALAVYSVEGVSGWTNQERAGASRDGLHSFADLADGRTRMSYRVHISPTLDRDNMEAHIQIDGLDHDAELAISLHLLCTNGTLPKRLGVGDIRISTGSGGTASIPCANILPITAPHPPPCDEDTLWKVLSNMRLNYIPLIDVDAFRAMIAAYAFRAVTDRIEARRVNKLLHSIRSIASPSTDRIFDGSPRRGARTTITMDQSFFICEGAMVLFGAVLNEFLSMYATVNSFHQLIVKEASRGEEYHWPARLGSAVRR